MRKPIIFALMASTVLAGCAAERQVMEQKASTLNHAETGMQAAGAPAAKADVSPIKMNNDVFVSGRPVRNENGDPLPARFESANGITLVKTTPASLREIAASLTELTKIPVVVAAAQAEPAANRATGSSPAAAPVRVAGPVSDPAALGAALQNIASGNGGPGIGGAVGDVGMITAPARAPTGTMTLNYSGRLSSLLNVVSAHFNVAWRYEGDRIVLDSVVTRTYDIPALPIIANLSFDLTSQGQTSGSGGSSASGQKAETKSASDTFKELQATIQAMVGPGATSINSTTGVVSVTGDPATVTRIGEYIKGMNERLNKQIAISVKVYSVTLKGSDEFNLDVAAILNNGKNGFNLGNAVSSAGVVPSAAAAGLGGAGLGWALLDTTSKWYGSNALVNALSQNGDVSVVTTASVTTVNGVPVPLQVGEVRDYVSKVTTTASGGSDTTQTAIETSSVNTGFNLHLVPRVDRSGSLLLQYGINISELTGSNDGFDTYTTGGQSVQLRRMNQRNFIQQAKIPNGQTLVLAGFEQVRAASDQSGTGHPSFPLLGGSRSAKMERQIIVIAITPTLLDLSKN